MQPDMDCTARYHALDALLLRALKDRTRHSPVDFTPQPHACIGSANKPAIRPTRWKYSVHGPDEYKRAFPPNGEDEVLRLKSGLRRIGRFFTKPIPGRRAKRLPRHWRPALHLPKSTAGQTYPDHGAPVGRAFHLRKRPHASHGTTVESGYADETDRTLPT